MSDCKGKSAVAKITKRTVDALAGQERERVVWGDDLTGFVEHDLIPLI